MAHVEGDKYKVLDIFEHFIFKNFIEYTLIPSTNAAMEAGGENLTYGEFLMFIRLWLMMARIIGPYRGEWFAAMPVIQFDGVPF